MGVLGLPIGTGPFDLIAALLKLLGITDMCTLSSNFAGCDGKPW